MGQRSQIIVRIPKYFLNVDNCNNREACLLVFHNQWLYGYGFISHLLDIMQGFNQYKNWYSQSSLAQYTPDYKEWIIKAINCANYKDITNIRKTHRYFNGGIDAEPENDNEHFFTAGSIKKLIATLDNNNGYIFLDIDIKGNIFFDIMNGTEDAEPIRRVTPQEYLELFYKAEEINSDVDIKNLLIGISKYVQKDLTNMRISKPKKKVTT